MNECPGIDALAVRTDIAALIVLPQAGPSDMAVTLNMTDSVGGFPFTLHVPFYISSA
jgi:hypothetical protein